MQYDIPQNVYKYSMNGCYQVITGVEFNRKAATRSASHYVTQATTSEGLAQGSYLVLLIYLHDG